MVIAPIENGRGRGAWPDRAKRNTRRREITIARSRFCQRRHRYRLVGLGPFRRRAIVGRSGLAAGPRGRGRRSNCAGRPSESTRALSAKGARRRGQKSLYFAMDATPPHELGGGRLAADLRHLRSRPVVSRGFRGTRRRSRSGRGVDFANGRGCAKNFGNAMDSELTAGGAYVTGETTATFKGYYRVSAGDNAVLVRSFVQFDGEGDTANSRERAIGGHPAGPVGRNTPSKRSNQSIRGPR